MNHCFNNTVIICKNILYNCYEQCFNYNNTITISNNNNNNNNDNDNYNYNDDNDNDENTNCYCACIKTNIEITTHTLCLYNNSFYYENILLLLALLLFISIYTRCNIIKSIQHPRYKLYNTLMINNDSNDNSNSDILTNTNTNTNTNMSQSKIYDENGYIILLPSYNDYMHTNTKNLHPPAYTI